MRMRLEMAMLLAVSALLGGETAFAETSLSLYGVQLKDANSVEFIGAAQRAGAHRLADEKGLPTFDSRGAGVPALDRFSLLADGDKLVAVQYEVATSSETLRKMLLAKYGQPRDEYKDPFDRHQSFDAEYLSECRFVWHFSDGMTLVWKQDFFGKAVLTYSDEHKFNAMMLRAQRNADASTVHEAAAASANF